MTLCTNIGHVYYNITQYIFGAMPTRKYLCGESESCRASKFILVLLQLDRLLYLVAHIKLKDESMPNLLVVSVLHMPSTWLYSDTIYSF